MSASLYPRINIPGPTFDPRGGEARTPLRIPAYALADDDVLITNAQKGLALAGNVLTPGGFTPPDAPGERLLPFWLATKGVVHLRIAFLDDPAAAVWPPGVPSSLTGTKVAVVPAREIPAGGLTINDHIIPLQSEWLPLGSPDTKTVPGGYATLTGTSLVGRVQPLTLTVDQAAPSDAIGAPWFLVIKNTIPLWVTFAATETLGDAATVAELPWIHIPATSAAVNLGGPFTLGNLVSPAGTVSGVRNYGPGALVVEATDTPESDGDDIVFVNASTIPAVSSGSIQLGYTAHDGLSALPVGIETNDPTVPVTLVGDYHNARISVTAESVGLADTILVLDASGSMLLNPAGTMYGTQSAADPALRRRWDNLVAATNQFVSGYTSFLMDDVGGGRLGIAVFPDVLNKTPGWQTRAGTMLPSVDVSAGLPGSVTPLLNGAVLEPGGMTPMGDGIGVAMGTDASTGMYQPATVAHRRWMVLMTDGAHNSGTVHPNQFIQADAVPDFVAKQIRLYAIGYTTAAGGTDVALLQNLAANGLNPVDSIALEESQYAQAAVGVGFTKTLTDTFLTALGASIGVTASLDPTGELSTKSPIAIHEFQVSPFDTGVGIFVDWYAQDSDRIQIMLISPHCEQFDQKELEQNPEFQFRVLPGYSHAYISRAAIAGVGHGPRHGTWKLVLRLGGRDIVNSHHEFSEITTEPYKFSIFNRSGLRLTGGATKAKLSTNQPIELVVQLQAHGAPVSGAKVIGTVDAPTADYGSILAGAVVDPHVMERVQKEGTADLLGLWALKAQALASDRGAIEVSRTNNQVVFEEAAPGVYSAKIQNAAVGGLYTTHVVATGSAEGVPYRRERAVSMNVEVLPDPSQTVVTYDIAEGGRLIVEVRPRDAHGNPVIFDPQSSPRLGIHATGAKPIGEVSNQFDGSYRRGFQLTGSGQPEVIVTFDDEVIVPASPLPDPGTFDWVERLISYEPGTGPKGDPKNALGPVKGPNDPFAPLGAGGSIELAPKAPFFLASHVAVFTHSKSTQPYEVYVGVRAGKRWLRLGVGHGPTQVFEVPKRWGPSHNILVRHARSKGEPVLLQGVGYVLRRLKSTGRD